LVVEELAEEDEEVDREPALLRLPELTRDVADRMAADAPLLCPIVDATCVSPPPLPLVLLLEIADPPPCAPPLEFDVIGYEAPGLGNVLPDRNASAREPRSRGTSRDA
jgi:hypothetical protein